MGSILLLTLQVEAFLSKDYASGLRDQDFIKGPIGIQQLFGVYWDLKSDAFTAHLSPLQGCAQEWLASRQGHQNTTRLWQDDLQGRPSNC